MEDWWRPRPAHPEGNNLAHRFCCCFSQLKSVALLASKIDNMIADIYVMVSLALQDVSSFAFLWTFLMIISLQRGIDRRRADDYIFGSVNADIKNDDAPIYADVLNLKELDAKPL